ncbi:MAG: histone deacetylase [Nanoarchaeota archaeon]|nr:histone deacetylase [Nanoarchaeota archaeon]
MKFIYNKLFLEHNDPDHPENNTRLSSIIDFGKIEETPLEDIPYAEKEIGLVHTDRYIQKVKSFAQAGEWLDGDTYTSKDSYRIACYAAGAAILASERNAFSLARPPGHHATKDYPMGFCLFNNIAVASKNLVDKGKKVFILDIDGHFGNGTADIFQEERNILFMSLHQYPAYPGSGWVDNIGGGPGKGHIINVPLPPDSGDDLLMDAITRLLPIIREFDPDHVGISAGFDGHLMDPLLNLRYTYNSYYEIGKLMAENFKNIFAVLEGGYNIDVLPKCVFCLGEGISGKKQSHFEERTTSEKDVIEDYQIRIKELEENLSEFWNTTEEEF